MFNFKKLNYKIIKQFLAPEESDVLHLF